MKEKKVLLIVNPVSGTLGSRDAMFEALKVFCAEGWTVTTALTQRRGHAIELAEGAAARGYDLAVCCGGDGTLNETLTGLMISRERTGTAVPCGYIPCGSTNDFAATLGISSEPAEAARAIVRSQGMPIDVGFFGGKRYFSYIASFGAFTQASYSAPQDLKNVVGHFAYIVEGLKDVQNLKPYRAKVWADGFSCTGDYIFGCVSNTRSIGGIVKLKEDEVGLDDGLFELILIKNPMTTSDLSNIISGLFSSDFSADVFEYVKTTRVRIEFEAPIYWSLDGEKVEGDRILDIQDLHRALTLMR